MKRASGEKAVFLFETCEPALDGSERATSDSSNATVKINFSMARPFIWKAFENRRSRSGAVAFIDGAAVTPTGGIGE